MSCSCTVAAAFRFSLPAGREVVDDVHLVAACEQRVDDVRADESRSSGDHRPHGHILRTMFVTFEGMDGSGKTTQVERLRAALEADGREVVTAREPGQTVLGEEIRNLVLHGGPMTPWAEALLYAASRAEVVARGVRPALERGADVLLDRYLDSSIVYQGIGRGLGVDEVLEVNLLATGGLLPDRTFVLAIEPGTSLQPRGLEAGPDRTRGRGLPRASRRRLRAARRALPGAGRRPRRRRSIPTCSRTGSSMSFDDLPEQPEARRLLRAAVAEGPAHAYLLHGPAGVGKRAAARTFAAELLGDERRVAAGTHPDLFLLEALGEMIRIDEVRALHRDLHMRPYEAERRVYVIADAHLLNEDAADALLEGPRGAAVVRSDRARRGRARPDPADDPLALPARLRSGGCRNVRCAPSSPSARRGSPRPRRARSRACLGRPARSRRAAARSGGAWPPGRVAARRALALRRSRARPGRCGRDAARRVPGRSARRREERAEAELAGIELTARESEQRLRRVQRGAEREELLASLEELASWYRDLVVVAAGAEQAAVHADRLEVLARGRDARAGRRTPRPRPSWRARRGARSRSSTSIRR